MSKTTSFLIAMLLILLAISGFSVPQNKPTTLNIDDSKVLDLVNKDIARYAKVSTSGTKEDVLTKHNIANINNPIEGTLKIHDIININDNHYVLSSYNYKDNTEKICLSIRLYDIDIDDSLKQLSVKGIEGYGGNFSDKPITFNKPINWVYGLILNPEAIEINVAYDDGKTVTYEVNNKDYYFIFRTDNTQSKPQDIRVKNNKGENLFEFDY